MSFVWKGFSSLAWFWMVRALKLAGGDVKVAVGDELGSKLLVTVD